MSATSKPGDDALTTRDALLEWLGYAPGSKGDRWASVGGQRDYNGGYMVWRCDDGWHILSNRMCGMLDGSNMRPCDIIDNPEHAAPTFIDALIYICKERYGDPDYVTIAHYIKREEAKNRERA